MSEPALLTDSEPTTVCPHCHERRPVAEFSEPREGMDALALPTTCLACHARGVPDPGRSLSVMDRQIIDLTLEGYSHAEVAHELMLPRAYIDDLFRGHGRESRIRAAFRLLLKIEGLDAKTLAGKLGELMKATRAQWNPEEKEFEHFPDNTAQLGAVRHLTKLRELDPPPKPQEGGPAVAVQIITNLGEGGGQEVPGTYTVKAKED